ncbi:tRNA uridine-5-carboxymethylaminomethyl(34) synthesis GTPase MnmE [Anaerosacchariphilus sp. NSJ-68]|uniref:tRNA modification GTPase MnmE n=2 Tax=Lachnospiraceae TaxID=186803 RepID=A0A923LEY6_9FIRM|nr:MULTISPECIES: tRNA uridine-5-carboxymethylaminomethyl(34) synthesis GTPase MnmE [Lachnospiraceae]MBC5661051.1 tRNA uridine-5-carboxymethylaminomethyl(34) synthesis GTPase MnmE [Anaerosacchariphilus hominis]MBC5699708.1 tRNA uridine-5-carboxymethylaminomethyl(34) synthesis GTPase MnmE [Roseburia difficilis]
MIHTDTIAAAATAMGSAGIGIIRISGPEAFAVLEKVFRPKNEKKVMREQSGYTVHYGMAVDGDQVLDEVLVMFMRGPHSYTAEDTAEIDCHGGRLVMQKILETVLKNGARAAEPGEFTKRAFLNGRIDLSQAEAVMDLIQSKNEMALRSSLAQLKGTVREKIGRLREKILYEMAFVEAALDDPEHISLDGYREELLKKVKDIQKEVEELLKSADSGRMLKEGIKTVILGKPNAGKSSLLNVLLGEERAIVTEIAGTTRDVLEEQLQLGEISLQLLDTAGIRSTEDVVEQIGVDRARKQAEDADLILYVADSSRPLDDSDEEILKLLEGKKALVLLNKSDLEPVITPESMEEKTMHPVLVISAKEGEGIRELEEKIRSLFFHGEVDFNDEVLITNLRQKQALADAAGSLKMVMESIESGMPEDFFTIDLKDAYLSLGFIIGEEIGDDLAKEIFGKFCMGK